MKIVIIGGGTAGMATATHLRRKNENDEIIILDKSDEFAISTCGLTFYLSGIIKDKEELIGATTEQMRSVFRIDVRLNHEVLGIDREHKLLNIEGRDDISYDKLVIATGALQLRPDIPGILGDNIFTMRSLRSAERIRDYYYGTNAQKIIILGGGDIGIEAAEAFIKMGAEVHIVESALHVLPHFDYDMAAGVQNALRQNNVHLHLNTTVKEFRETEAELSSGDIISYDMALVATGVKPDVKLPIMADLDVGESGGIVVNQYMQTNDENIYASGDNVEITNMITGAKERTASSSIAIKQARIVADHIAGVKNKFVPIIGTSISKVFELTAAMAGCSENTLRKNNLKFHKVFLFQNNHAGYLPEASQMLLKLMFDENGKILGIEGVGRNGVDKRVDMISALIKKDSTYQDLIEAEVTYSPPYATSKDAVNNLGSLAEGVIRDKVRYVYQEAIDWTKVGNEIMMIDVRSPENFKSGHIPNAVNFPIASIRENISSIPRDRQVILYCNRGYASYNAYCILTQRGYDNVYLLAGGMDLYMEIALDEEAE